VAVDAAGQHQQARGLDHLRGVGDRLGKGGDAAVLHADVAARGAEAGGHRGRRGSRGRSLAYVLSYLRWSAA
jgi:hypothetical protein